MPQKPSGQPTVHAPVEVPGPELRLIGRSAEVAQVLALIDDAETAGGVLVVRGDAGIGKSTLLRAATDHARERGHLLLGTSGTPAEQHLPFAALHHLLGPALSATTLLSVPHRAALNHVFGYASAGSPSPPVVIALAALELLAEHASDRPLLVAVDDAQWLDEASLDVLLFVARRLRTERIVLLLATRESETADGANPIVHDLVLKPLDDNAARLLLTVAHPTLSSGDIGRTLRMAAGNPLALLELPRVGESSTHDDAAPLPVALEHAFAGQLDHLTPPARAVLLAVAIQDGGTAADVWPVAETLTGTAVSADLLDGAATAGLITVRGDTVTFRHPLVRSAVRQAADPDLLRAAHRAWAQALISVDPDRYAWHRSWAVRGPDKQVADELEAAARRSRRRGAVAAASAGWSGPRRCPSTAAVARNGCWRRRMRRTNSAGTRTSSGCWPMFAARSSTARRRTDWPTWKAFSTTAPRGIATAYAPWSPEQSRRGTPATRTMPCCCSRAPGAAAGGGIWVTSVKSSSTPRTAFRFQRVTRGGW